MTINKQIGDAIREICSNREWAYDDHIEMCWGFSHSRSKLGLPGRSIYVLSEKEFKEAFKRGGETEELIEAVICGLELRGLISELPEAAQPDKEYKLYEIAEA